MQKRLYKRKRKSSGALFVVFCALLVLTVACICAFFARCAREEQPSLGSTETFSSPSEEVSSVFSTPEPTETTEVPVSETTPVHTETEEPSTAEPSTAESSTSEISATEGSTVFTSYDEADGVRRVENFIFYETDTPEYRLASLLMLEVPPVVKTAAVTETAALEATDISPEATGAPATGEVTPESAETTEKAVETYTYEIDGEVALYYKDLTDGETIVFAPEKKIFAASMIKAVYAYALLQVAERGEIDLKEEFVYTSAMFVEGSGDFKKVEDGTVFTAEELISKTILRSDNTAFSMLRGRYGFDFFSPVMEEKGITPVRYSAWWRPGVRSYGEFFAVLHGYITGENKYGAWFGELMCKSLQTVMLQRALRPEKVAHKYGWDENSYCDGAVVLSEHPYVLVFMSNLDEGHLKRANNTFIYEVGGLIKQMHDAKYAVASSEVSDD